MRGIWPRAARALAAASVALATFASRTAAADDVDLIPQGVLDAPPVPPSVEPRVDASPPRSSVRARLFLEDGLTLSSAPQHVPVPYPATLARDWQNRSSFDASAQWQPWKPITFTLSDRLNVFEQDRQAIVSANTIRNDLREASVAWEPASNMYLEAGRINVRNGAALGYNPTDFFKTRTLVGQASLDPSVIRQNRLGTLMVREQTIWSGGSASVAFAPKVADPSPINGGEPVGVDPHFAATNASNRVLCTLNLDLLDLSPQLLGYFELHRSKIGANISRTFGDAVVVYAEWASGLEANLAARANAFGRATQDLPANAPTVPPTATSSLFRNDVATGFSWTIATRLTLDLEYHFHQAAFTRADWQNWFNLGSALNAPARLTNALWYVRGYANDQQEPMTQQQVFVRASWPRAFVTELELTAFAFVDLLDASALTQLSANYYLSDAWTASAYLSANLGQARSERGSLPQRANVIFQVTRYL